MLTRAVESYLAMRRALGFELRTVGNLLHSFARFAHARGEHLLRAQTVIDWAGCGASAPQRARRLHAVIRFGRHLRAEDERHEIPPEGLFGSETRPRPVPYIFSPEQIRQLIEATSRLGPAGSLRPHTYQTLFALLACTGLRVSEAIQLRCQDLTADGLVVRESKFRKSRLVPLHGTARAGVERYLTRRHWMCGRDDPLFLSHRARPVHYSAARTAFRTTLQTLGVDVSPSRRRPTLHSLRHTFAVRALEACPDGRDRIAQHTVALSTYLGHSTMAATYWYLEATPHLLRDIAEACERLVRGETS